MNINPFSVTRFAFQQQRFERAVNSTIDRLGAGATVRPKDDPSAFASYQKSRVEENRLRTAALNAERAQAFGVRALDELAQAAGALDELRELVLVDGGDARTQRRIDELVDQLADHSRAAFKGRRIFASASAADAPTPEPVGPRGESLRLRVDQAVPGRPTRIDFRRELNDAVVIANVSSANETAPVQARVTRVGRDGAEVVLQEFEADNGTHAAETVDVLALEAGSYTLGSGQRVQVGRFELGLTRRRIEFDQDFESAPIVLATVQSNNETTAVVIRQDNVTADGFDVFLQEQESLRGTGHTPEVVGFVAIEAGRGELDGLGFVAGRTGRSVTHQTRSVGFGETLADPSFFASLETSLGGDTAAIRTTAVGPDGAALFVQEETSRDLETNHVAEGVSYFALDGTGLIGEPPQSPADQSGPEGFRFAVTPELARNVHTAGFGSIDLGQADDDTPSLSDLASGGGLFSGGGLSPGQNRDEALRVIDAARAGVTRSQARVRAFIDTEVGGVDAVTRASLDTAATRRQQLEDRAGAEANAEAARLLLLSAGQALAAEVAEAQADTLLALLDGASGSRVSRGVDTGSLFRVGLEGQRFRLADAIDHYRRSTGRGAERPGAADAAAADTSRSSLGLDLVG